MKPPSPTAVAAPIVSLLVAAVGCAASPAPQKPPEPSRAVAATSASSSVAPSVDGAASASAAVPSSAASVATAASAAPSASASASASVATHKIALRKGAKVALVGDSMVHAGLSYWFEKRVTEAGGTFLHDSWASSKLRDWAESMRLPNMMFAQRPDAVFVVVGTNEVHYKAPHMAEDVRAIVARFGKTPCVLIGPPVWDYQAGIVDALRDNAGHCFFVDSTDLKIRRQKDGIHPSLEGGKAWTDAIFAATVE